MPGINKRFLGRTPRRAAYLPGFARMSLTAGPTVAKTTPAKLTQIPEIRNIWDVDPEEDDLEPRSFAAVLVPEELARGTAANVSRKPKMKRIIPKVIIASRARSAEILSALLVFT